MISSGTYTRIMILGLVFCFSISGSQRVLSTEPATENTSESHADYSVLELEALIRGDDNMQQRKGVTLRWKDTVDGGDDPMTAGCHMEYQTAACTDAGVYFAGDACLNARKLSEYTNSACHVGAPIDLKTYDCNKYCIDVENAWFGRCRIVHNACGAGNPSAQCKCFPHRPDV